MDIIEAIDAWIDEHIEELTDQELEAIFEILEVVAASEYSELEPHQIFRDEIEDLVAAVEGSEQDRSYARAILRASLYGDTMQANGEIVPAGADIDQDAKLVADPNTDDEPDTEQIADLIFDPDLSTDDDDDEPDPEQVTDPDTDQIADLIFDPDLSTDDDDDEPDPEQVTDPDTDLIFDPDLSTDDDDDEPDPEQVTDPDTDLIFDPTDPDLSTDDDDDEPDPEQVTDPDTDLIFDPTDPDLSTDDDDDPDTEQIANQDPTDTDLIFDPTDADLSTDDDDDDPDTEQIANQDPTDTDLIFDPTDADLSTDDNDDDPDTEQIANQDPTDTDLIFDPTDADLSTDDTSSQDTDGAGSATPNEPVELRPFDELGPSFLSDESPERPRGLPWRHIALASFYIFGLTAFGLGMVDLIASLDEQDLPEETSERQPIISPTVTTVATPVPQATPRPADAPAPAPAPTAEPLVPGRVGIRVSSGRVMVATIDPTGGPPTMTEVYTPDDTDLHPATDISWIGDQLGVVDDKGSVLLIDPGDDQAEPVLLYEAGGGLGDAIKMTRSLSRVAVLSSNGDITLLPTIGESDPDAIDVVWDASEAGAGALDISAILDLVSFTLDDGTAKMVVTSLDNAVVDLWNVTEQPAGNIVASPKAILFGIGQGAVASYPLGETDGPPIVPIWDPITTGGIPAIGYSPAGPRTAVVVANGTVLLADDTGTGEVVWDAAMTEVRALGLSSTDRELIVLLETGSVVRVPIGNEEAVESIWDITDESLEMAVEVSLEDTSG